MDRENCLFHNGPVYYQGKFRQGILSVVQGKIAGFSNDSSSASAFPGRTVDLQGNYLIPGFIDIHTHGGANNEFIDAAENPSVLNDLCGYYASTGTTSVIAGLYTNKYARITNAAQNISRFMHRQKSGVCGAAIMGISIEGPYISKERCGAQNPDEIRDINLCEFDELINLSDEQIKLITIAPEKDGALNAVSYLRDRGITVTVGHSKADYSTALKAADCGASLITHFFNGLNPLHHRDPGIVGAGLFSPKFTLELICDGIHVHPDIVKFLFGVKSSDKICCITDSVKPAGCRDGEYMVGGMKVIKSGNKIVLKDGDNLAGSCLTMIDAFKKAIAFTAMSMDEILPSFTIIPAKVVKISDVKGTLDIGKDADFLILDHNLALRSTYVKGANVFNNTE